MDNHPIPQDVTGFKFKLIGSVTIKQFLYLLGGGIMAVLLIFVFPGSPLIRFPLAMIFAGASAALAFIPIEGRPMDKMIMNFAKAVPAENLFLYHKQGVNLAAYEFFKPPIQANTQAAQAQRQSDVRRQILFTQFGGSSFQPDENERAMLQNVNNLFTQTPGTAAPVANSPATIATNSPSAKKPIKANIPSGKTRVVLPPHTTKPTIIQKPTTPPVKAEESKATPPAQPMNPAQPSKAPSNTQTTPPLQTLTQKADAEVEKIEGQAHERAVQAKKERELLEARIKELEKNQKAQTVFQPTEDKQEPKQTENARVLSHQTTQFKAGFPSLPDVANVILGIVKDPRGKVLPNILVEIVDSNSIPVRAFKTNQLGQFASATPLPRGTYTVHFEDPQKNHDFDSFEITLDNKIFQPLEIISTDQREKLRREIFGS